MPSAAPNILVIGSINMDVVTPIAQLPAPGQTLMAGDVLLIPGGKGANAAVAAARLGGKVRMVGCVGSDTFGKTLRDHLQQENIDVTHVEMIANAASGTAVILLDEHTGQNSILVSAGSNARLDAPTDSAIYQGAAVLMLQLETPLKCNVQAAQRAKQAGVCVMLDPAPAMVDLPDELLACCDILLPNETELATLTGLPCTTMDEITSAAKALLKRGGSHVVVTLGERGAMHISSDGSCKHFAAKAIKPVDTTAAGDTFAGALAVQLGMHVSLAEAIPFALAAGSLACMTLGAQTSIPTAAQVRAFMQ